MKERNIRIALIAVCVALAFVAVCFVIKNDTGVEWEQKTYYVEPGDTLWAIGSRVCPENVDIRGWIEDVKQINEMTSSQINAGDKIIIIVPAN